MSGGAPPRDASYSALQTKTGVAERFTATQFDAARLNVTELFVNGIPVEDYVYQLVQNSGSGSGDAPHLSSFPATFGAGIVSDTTPSTPTTASFVNNETDATSTVEFAQVAARAAHSHVADVTHAFHDPVNGKPGYVLTSDDSGQGSWQPLPRSGDVEGPLLSRTGSVVVFDSGDGRILRDSGVVIENDGTLKAPQVRVDKLFLGVFDGGDSAGASVAVKGSQNALEWKDTSTLPIIKQLLAQLSQLQSTQTQTQAALVQAQSQLESLVHQRSQLAQASPEPMVWDIEKVPIPVSAPPGSVLMTSLDEPGKMTWHTASRFVTWKADSDDLPQTLPMCVDGQLHATDIQVTDRNQLSLDALKTNKIVTDEVSARGLLAKDITAKGIIAEDASVQKVSTVELTLPVEAKTGLVLTAENDDGKCRWMTPQIPSIPKVPKNPVHGSLVLFDTSDVSCTNLTESSLRIQGTALQSADSTLLLWNNVNQQLILGADATRIGVGAGALASSNPEVSFLVGIGKDCLSKAEKGESTAVGHFSQAQNRTGEGNTTHGFGALQFNEQGHHNSAFGHSALRNCKGSANVGVGSGAFLALVDGDSNTGIGTGCGEAVVHGKGNVVMGDGAGPAGDYNYSISIGKGAHALGNGDLALGSVEAPLKLASTATSGALSGLNPSSYLTVTINGKSFKVALFDP